MRRNPDGSIRKREEGDMIFTELGGFFGEPPTPKLPFLRLKSPPLKVKKANVLSVAKYHRGQSVVVSTNPSKGLGGLRSAEVQKVELADPNYAPLPLSDEPEALYLLKLDSTTTTYARASPRWVRESQVFPKPIGVQKDAWQQASVKWDRVWEEDKEFDYLRRKASQDEVKRTLLDASRKLLEQVPARNLEKIPISRVAFKYMSDEERQNVERLGLVETVQKSLGLPKPKDVSLQEGDATDNSKGGGSRAGPGMGKSVSAAALLQHGRMPRSQPSLERIRTPPQRHRKVGTFRQRRVRNQVAQPSENPTIVDARNQCPWYTNSRDEVPAYRQRRRQNDAAMGYISRAAAAQAFVASLGPIPSTADWRNA